MRQKVRRFFYSAQRKMILTITLILSLLFLVTFVGVNQIVRRERYETLSEQYFYLNDKLIATFEEIKEELDQLSGQFILNEYVQKTLTNQKMTAADIEMMERELAFYNKSFLDYYLVIDNKGNFYAQHSVKLDLDTFASSEIYKSFGSDYSRTSILWTRDTVFGTNEISFFAVRYIRSLNYNHAPGVLILKLNDNLLQRVRESIDNDRLAYFILDDKQEVCFSQMPGGREWDPEDEKSREVFAKVSSAKNMPSGTQLKDGIVSWRYDEDSHFTIVTYAPEEVSEEVIRQIQAMMLPVFFVAYIIALVCAVHFSRRFTKPIRYISDTMSGFGENCLESRIDLDTNTELDEIGRAYNKMVSQVRTLMEDVHQKESKLRENELATLMYQIRPHFLYNTLDTIYMLARIQKEETIMHMIQSLSRFLRINLSNGNEIIEVQKELEHVSSYLEIQKIRNAELFEYEVEMEEDVAGCLVTKMILQPVAENCIKYGFSNLDEGGRITIRAIRKERSLVFHVKNNGKPIAEDKLEKLNLLESAALDKIDGMLEHKQGGYGICNVVKRLRLRYGENVRFYYERLEDGTNCVIKIPLGDGVDRNRSRSARNGRENDQRESGIYSKEAGDEKRNL